MGFHRPLETDGTPAPGMRWEELDNMARRQARRQAVTVETLPVENLVAAVQMAKYNYDQFMSLVGITYHREQWHAFCVSAHLVGSGCANPLHTLDGWWKWYNVFTRDDDARDLADTQADSLR